MFIVTIESGYWGRHYRGGQVIGVYRHYVYRHYRGGQVIGVYRHYRGGQGRGSGYWCLSSL